MTKDAIPCQLPIRNPINLVPSSAPVTLNHPKGLLFYIFQHRLTSSKMVLLTISESDSIDHHSWSVLDHFATLLLIQHSHGLFLQLTVQTHSDTCALTLNEKLGCNPIFQAKHPHDLSELPSLRKWNTPASTSTPLTAPNAPSVDNCCFLMPRLGTFKSAPWRHISSCFHALLAPERSLQQ